MPDQVTVGAQVIGLLAQRGVRHVFGIPGVHNLELYRGLSASSIEHVGGRHEQGLGFMADGYARVSGAPGVCLTISGPGVTNIATAVAQAYGDSVPMIVIASVLRHDERGAESGVLHELRDQRGLMALLAGRALRVDHPREVAPVIAEAFEVATSGRPRPVYVEIGRDVLAMPAVGAPAASREGRGDVWKGRSASRSATVESLDLTALDRAVEMLGAAERPVVLAGGGAVGAADAIRNLAERLGAPVVMTVNARGLLGAGHPLAVPASPSLDAVRRLIAAADAVFAIGTELGPTDYDMYEDGRFPKPARLIRVDIDPAQLNRGIAADVALAGDAAEIVSALRARGVGERPTRGGQEAALEAREASLAGLPAAMRRQVALLDEMREAVPEAVIVGDSTQPVYAGNLFYAAPRPRSWFNSATGYGTLGYALPAAIGAGLAAPDRPVICLTGDGGLQLTLGELAVPREVDAWLAIAVWSNGGYEEIRSSMRTAGIEPRAVDARPPALGPLAAAYGCPHRRITTGPELAQALREFAARRQVVLLELDAEALA